MARTTRLNDFLTDIANAIRRKKGTSNQIFAYDFDNEIRTIKMGLEIKGKVITSQLATKEWVDAGDFVKVQNNFAYAIESLDEVSGIALWGGVPGDIIRILIPEGSEING